MPIPSAAPDALGLRLAQATAGEFDVLGALGRGGMAAVYLAHDRALDRRVAIKVLSPELLAQNAAAADRFVLEARTAASLTHPGIIPIYAVRHAAGLHFFVMQFVDGWPLDVLLRQRGPVPPPLAGALLSQAAHGLAFAHRKGVVHRDLKPGNIMVDGEGRAVVLDFGIAKVAQSPTTTLSGTAIGTPTYMSPEQCRGQPATAASDQYALGMVAYELLAGRPAFVSESTFGLIYAHVQEAPPPLGSFCPACPLELAAVVMRMIEKDPAARWPSLDALVEQLGTAGPAEQSALRALLGRDGSEALHPAVERLPEAAPTLPPVPVPRAPAPASIPAAPPRPARVPLQVAVRRGMLTVGQSFPLHSLLESAPAETPLEWRSDDPGVVRVSSDGRATAESTGVVTIVVSDGRAEVRTRLEVTRTGVTRLRLQTSGSTLAVGERLQLTAEPLDPLGMKLTNRLVEWQSSAPQVASVSGAGAVTAHAPGQVLIRAVCGGREAEVQLSVGPERITGVLVLPRALRLARGERMALQALALTARGRTLAGYPVEWATTDPSIVQIGGDGTVLARAEGHARVVAVIDGWKGVVPVEVRPTL